MTDTTPAIDKKDIEDNKVLAALSYIFILCFVPLLLARDSKFAQYHAKQGLVLFVAEVILMVLSNILIFIPVLGWFVMMICYIAFTVLSIIGILKALEGTLWEMPVLGEYAKKLKI
ncbi:MAG: hypothetical protein UU40_C0014G0014 [Candidatus Uhrbacteria bacterium GW2011_GWD2_41_121]|uniref:Chloroplast import component protein (Tic20) n=1 Tax=Candidatus Uhrbacteria bacterium GW2011_GWC1_41_20 TaxID=1618983 RepID=A0A0G0VGS8_9BACT|nr:MAG: hypothetical protein UT52_C0004G0029 [Candidatus Uhrbacteria bacterium GW2011_GWE1_39_46]KKR63776.1 MAG: hypothetical protein UU04_C0012G0014 [Candidatus Uhrbacteria bacterium GW2011_GWC2_40_450]KKR89835.1 MAG: hypothetical protein UU40_C0014G0014 [Candidatus Uhrbacteria bacterium GW2011_GWD2_41_121]KKR95741.1 MAG: hypothetical protein UU46_C0015G0014 [Candidatus Uhrbacteria bacterium GW2011_GWD1_41_16]KKR98836.1 MAG: hypothetical protein UU50_C0015G0005 [Candidatus Uhrbacteria bacteriu